ncbi:MAG: hypothetical protein R2882_09665 [Gemmatimonadales bacterium]
MSVVRLLPGLVMLIGLLAVGTGAVVLLVRTIRLLAQQGGSPFMVVAAPSGGAGLPHRAGRALRRQPERGQSPDPVRPVRGVGQGSGDLVRQSVCRQAQAFARVRNFMETAKLKVERRSLQPHRDRAVVRQSSNAEALFEVDDYENFVKVQSEAALRSLASTYPYDAHESDQSRSAAAPRVGGAPAMP